MNWIDSHMKSTVVQYQIIGIQWAFIRQGMRGIPKRHHHGLEFNSKTIMVIGTIQSSPSIQGDVVSNYYSDRLHTIIAIETL